MEVKERIFEIVANVCETTPDQITEESTIGDFPTWDSMGHLTIVQKLEEVFEVDFDPDELMDLEDVSDFIKAVKEKLA